MIERVGCSWFSEDRQTTIARHQSPRSAAYHDERGDDLTKCDAWVCVCGMTDTRGGSWETTNRAGVPVEPTPSEWLGYMKCTSCGRLYDESGLAVTGPEKLSA